jgi:arylsulfatase A-like enzyme
MDKAYNLPRFEGVRTDRYKFISYYEPSQEWELFDLEKDPNELHSVYDDPAYDSVRERLHRKLAELRVTYDIPKNTDESSRSIRE